MISVMYLDITGMLAELSGTDSSAWEEVEGPNTGCGLDYWHHHPEVGEAYGNVDQTCVVVSIQGETVSEGDYLDNEWLSRFVTDPVLDREANSWPKV